MATGVGLRVADDECVAAVVTAADADSDSESQFLVRPSILHMTDDGDTVLGGSPPTGHTHSVRGFARSVGDPDGVHVDDGDAYRAEDMVATALFCLIEQTSELVSGAVEVYATYPGDWSPQRVTALRGSLDYLGLRAVVLVSEADLPSSLTEAGATSGLLLAHDAARTALAAVLATPAGATAPDPAPAANALDSTDILPTLTPPPPTQAYSVARPVTEVAPAPEPTPRPNRRTAYSIAGAAGVGVVLGALVVTAIFNLRQPAPAAPKPLTSVVPASPASIASELPPPPSETPAAESLPPEVPSVQPLVETEDVTTTDVPTTSLPPSSTEPPPPPPSSAPTTTDRFSQLPSWTYPFSPIPTIPPAPTLPSPHWQYP